MCMLWNSPETNAEILPAGQDSRPTVGDNEDASGAYARHSTRDICYDNRLQISRSDVRSEYLMIDIREL